MSQWSVKQIEDLRKNYSYYINHHDDAEKCFNRKWLAILQEASRIGISKSNLTWTFEQINDLRENYVYYNEHKKEAEEHFKRKWNTISSRASQLSISSMETNKDCALFLGYHVAERVLSYVFKDVQRMSVNNPGFDFICNKGYKIDVKSSCLYNKNSYNFNIGNNKIADYFLLIGFDNRENLNPQHIWLIKSNEIIVTQHSSNYNRKLNEFGSFFVINKTFDILSKYELTDKLKETIKCCDALKKSEQ